jgi:hypothetical protein
MIHNMQNTSTDESQQLYKLGDLVFRIAFRSCDTVERGAFMYEKALDYYVQHLMDLENEANKPFSNQNVEAMKSYCSSIYDRIRFMLVALNHPEEFVASISSKSIWDDLCSPDTSHNSTLQLAIGLLKMKLISDLRSGSNYCSQFSIGSIRKASPNDTQGLFDDVVSKEYSNNLLAEQEMQLLRHVNAQPNLWSAILDRSGNLSEYTCPDLFAPHPPEGTLRELYCFVQDCFFLDQGISLVLNILPDLEDYQEYCDEER